MIALWWLVSLALVVLSALLLVAGFRGKEGVLRIGQPRPAEPEDVSGRPSGLTEDTAPGLSAPGIDQAAPAQPGHGADQAAPALPGDAIDQTAPGLPGDPAVRGASEPPIDRRMNLPNVAIGAAGVVVGLGAILIFAI